MLFCLHAFQLNIRHASSSNETLFFPLLRVFLYGNVDKGLFFWQHTSVMHDILVKYRKWIHSAEQKHFSVATTCCIRAVSHFWGTESICNVCLLLHSLYIFMLGKTTRDAVHILRTKSDFAYAGLSDVLFIHSFTLCSIHLPPSCAVVMKSGNLNFQEPFVPVQACNGTALPKGSTLHGH